MKSLLISLGLTIALSCAVFADPPCHTSELRQCYDIAIKWFHTLPKQSIPTTEEDVSAECEAFGKAIECGLKYRDSCMTPLQKEAIALVIEGGLDFNKDFCSSNSQMRAKYLSHAQCLNKVAQSDAVKDQIQYILAVVEGVTKIDTKDAVMYGCCGYRKIHGEFLKMGIDSCGQEATDMVIEMINWIFAQLPDVICTNMDGNEDKCKALLPPLGTQLTNEGKSTAIFAFLKDTLKNWIDL